MAEIKPIRPIRYTEKAGDILKNVCPPYDIINDAQRKELIDKCEYNIVRLEKPEGETRYADAAKLLGEWKEAGILARDEKEGIFVYRERFTVKGREYVFSGMICLVGLREFSEQVVLPHEETLSKAKRDRFELLNATHCNFSSVYSLYLDEKREVKPLLDTIQESKPIHEFTDSEGVTHTLWKTEDESIINAITAAFADKQLFIADGHHRYETSLNYRRYAKENGFADEIDCEHILMTLVDMDNDGLVVMPTHRLIRGIEINKDELLAKCEDDFEIKEYPDINKVEEVLAQCDKAHAYALYTGGEGFTLLVRIGKAPVEDHSDAYCNLDVTVLHSLVLENALGIDKENMANQVNLRYTRDIDEAVESVKSGESTAAFILNATKVHEIKAVSLAGDKMPQKSTYFYPKLITGLVINTLDK